MSTYYEVKPTQAFDPTDVIMGCAESGADSILLDEGSLPPDFFDLSSGTAGELLHRLSIYRVRMAAVVPVPAAYSPQFQAFAQESNRGDQYRFFSTRQEAVAWLESA